MQVTTIGIDLAKNVFHVHCVDANDKVVFNKPLRRAQVLPFFAKLAPCLIGIEACASAHYWARELKKLGHNVRLMPAKDVMAYVKRGKNDAIDAAACCEAVRRPTVRTVPVKTVDQQAQLMQHRVRDLMIRQRTQSINALRSHMAELGIVAAQGYEGLKELLAIVADTSDARLPEDARASLSALVAQIASCQAEIGAIEKRLLAQHRKNADSKRLETIPSIGVIGASAIVATGSGCFDLQEGARLRGLDRHCPARGFDRRQAAAGTYLKTRRPILAAHPNRRSACGLEAGACPPREIPLGDAATGTQAGKGCCGCNRQQDRAHRLGGADQEGELPCSDERGCLNSGGSVAPLLLSRSPLSCGRARGHQGQAPLGACEVHVLDRRSTRRRTASGDRDGRMLRRGPNQRMRTKKGVSPTRVSHSYQRGGQ